MSEPNRCFTGTDTSGSQRYGYTDCEITNDNVNIIAESRVYSSAAKAGNTDVAAALVKAGLQHLQRVRAHPPLPLSDVTPSAVATATATASPGATRAATSTVAGQNQPVDSTSTDVLAAALRTFNGVPQANCQTNNPQRKLCVGAPSVGSAGRGIATVGVGDPSGGGFNAVLGKDPTSIWQFWFGTQNTPYQLLDLPGRVIVCAGGDNVNVRRSPDPRAPVAGTLRDRSTATAEQFALTQPGQFTPGSPPKDGAGWYRLSAPVQGWASSRFLASATTDPNCQIHDVQVTG